MAVFRQNDRRLLGLLGILVNAGSLLAARRRTQTTSLHNGGNDLAYEKRAVRRT
jgi:hypothetical protein